MRSLQSTIGGGGGFGLGSLFGGGAPGVTSAGGIVGAIGPTSVGGAPLVPAALGHVFAAGQVIPFAAGGVPDLVSSPTPAPMALFGEEVEEAIMPLRRGSDGKLGIASSGRGGRSTNVIIYNHTDAQPAVQTAPNGDVTVTLRRAMDAAAADSVSSGGARRVLARQFGVKPFTGQ
jgi:phage-related minor tail protein